MTDDWQKRIDAVWATAGDTAELDVLAAIDALVAERPADDPDALFEAAGARDFADLESEAEPLYRRALENGLEEPSRGRAIIQLASTLRNLGEYDEAIALLDAEFGDQPEHPLADVAGAFVALCLASNGEDARATVVALDLLSRHLPEYQNAVRRYAAELLD
jgi:tetratricopeptide (TPR) repeat protein